MKSTTSIRTVGINARIAKLEAVKREISGMSRYHLSYIHEKAISNSCFNVTPANLWIMKHIKDLLDKHDNLIRKEIDEEIEALKKEIETL